MDEWRRTPTPLYKIQEVGPFPRPRLAATFSPSHQAFSTTPESVRFSAYRDPRQRQCRVERSRKRRCCVVVGKLVFLAEKRATTTVQFASICRNWGGSRYGQAAGRRGPMIRREVFAPAKCVLFLLNVHSFDDASRWSKTSWWTLSCEIITNNKFCYEKCKLTPLHGTKSALNQPYGLHLPFHFTRKAIPATLVQKSARFEVGVINISPFHPASKNETRALHAEADLVQTQKKNQNKTFQALKIHKFAELPRHALIIESSHLQRVITFFAGFLPLEIKVGEFKFSVYDATRAYTGKKAAHRNDLCSWGFYLLFLLPPHTLYGVACCLVFALASPLWFVLAHSPNVFMVYAFFFVPFGVLLLLLLSFLVCAQRVFIIFM